MDDIHISSTRWYDNKAVTLLSTFTASEPVSEVYRWNRQNSCYQNVPCPHVVSVYNKHMGGVDLIDSLIGLYCIKIRSKKWYHRLFFHLLDMTIVNAWLLYRRAIVETAQVSSSEKVLSLHEFKASVAASLCRSGLTTAAITKRGRPAANEPLAPLSNKRTTIHAPDNDTRFGGLHPYPTVTTQKLRCRQKKCTGQSRVACSKCAVHLCLHGNKNCFIAFHTS